MGFLDWSVHHKISLLVIVAFIIGVFLVYSFYPKGVCNVESYNLFYFLKAVRTNDAKWCEKIRIINDVFFKDEKEQCLAKVHQSNSFCSEKNTVCTALALNDLKLCGDDELCTNLILQDSALCEKSVSEQNLLKEEKDRLTKICLAYTTLDAEFFISGEELTKC